MNDWIQDELEPYIQPQGRESGSARGRGRGGGRQRRTNHFLPEYSEDSPPDHRDCQRQRGRGYGCNRGGGRSQDQATGFSYGSKASLLVDEPKRKNSYRPVRENAREHSDKVHPTGGKKKGPPAYCLTSEKVEELAEADVEALITEINLNEIGFLKAFQHKKFLQHNLTLKRLVKLLFNLVESREAKTTASRVLSQMFAPGSDYALFITSVEQLFRGMIYEQKHYIRQENIEAFSHFVRIGKYCVETFPHHAVQTFPTDSLKASLVKAQARLDYTSELDTIAQTLQELETSAENFEKEQIQPKLKPWRLPRRITDAEREPPEPFTTVSILPAVEEIYIDARPFLRPNIVHGNYRNWDHYLDVQFRLLREDFVGPLRKGIADFLESKSLLGGDVRVYTKVRLQQPVCLGSGMGFDVSFDLQPFRRVNWDYTKRLINGSLLCLSTDKFVTGVFATVVERKTKNLEQGIVTVKFEGSVNGFQMDPKAEYTMVESVAYFEAYRHVLGRLQQVSLEHELPTMPFNQYIVECTFDQIPLPLYARFLQPGRAVFNLQGTIAFKRGHRASTVVDLSDLTTWPDVDITDLDSSQLEALKAALTQELSVIQGPPGTGKTYIGLKIVQGLLANRHLWDPHKKSPILVVCYTNHALDQFLEGIQQNTVGGKPPNITRIGGRCKSESLADCTLQEKVGRAKEARSIPGHLYREFAKARTSMIAARNNIQSLMKQIDVSKTTLLTVEVLTEFISRLHLHQLASFSRKYPIEVWLGLQVPDSKPAVSFPVQPQAVRKEAIAITSDEDSDNEVQMIHDDRLVEGNEIVYRPPDDKEIALVEQYEDETDTEGWTTVKMDKRKRQKLIRKQLSCGLKPLSSREVRDLRTLKPQDRWRLYLYWRNKYTENMNKKLEALSQTYEESCKEFQERRQERDVSVVEGSDVVGMTTTGAAKHNHIIKTIKPKIVVVEEAAEIFEPHIFTSLSPSVQQLVLIGDHKQLRPKPTHHLLEVHYNFNVSMFERLIMNGCPHQTLNIQHRMRPEIASLITPAVYTKLYNHTSVENYDHVRGVGKSLFFINHNYAEASSSDDNKSHSNAHEAKFLAALCDYLLKQGYNPSEITIITFYSGQVVEMKKNLKQRKITGVRTVAVDDFQGEENEIILLSLVRSNKEREVGFLKTENRVCVALSRAKKGLYIIGNARMFLDQKSTIWPTVIRQLHSKECLNNFLPLCCQIHPDQKVNAVLATDFSKCPEGGCQKLCNVRLDCGHACKRMCHPRDRDHKNYTCKEKSRKKLPGCGHLELVPCSSDLKKIKCTQACRKILQCGHPCKEKCSRSCTELCKELVDKTLQCGHIVQDCCYLMLQDVVCSVTCNATLECGHKCTGTCGECKKGRLHIQCKAKCGRTLMCEHICKFPCTPSCPPCTEPCANFCIHSKCPKMCFEPCQPCQEPCAWSCPHKKCTESCGEPCNRSPCNKPCTKHLKCRHKCIGICGEPCPKLCRICNKAEVTEIFFGTEEDEDAKFVLLPDCGHIFEATGLDEWMSIKTDKEKSQEVTFKACPKCKTPVKKCLRYSNAIKQYLKDIEQIKLKQMDAFQSADLETDLSSLKQSLSGSSLECIEEELSVLERVIEIDSLPGRKQLLMFPHVIKAKLTLLSHIANITKILDAVSEKPHRRLMYSTEPPISANISTRNRIIKRGLNTVKQFIMQDFLFQQQISDAEAEIRRLTLLAKISEFEQNISSRRKELKPRDEREIKTHIALLQKSGWKAEKITPKKEEEILQVLHTLSQNYRINGLTETERIKIVEAIGLSKGHWFKCPNGHFYCIGECGGAMERSKCPECQADIGGTQHQLLATNQLAPEMDGARYAAWSDMANMGNFDPQDLARLQLF